MRHGRAIILCLLLAFGQAGAVCAELAAHGMGPHAVTTDMAADEPEDCRSGHACHDALPAVEEATGCACGGDAGVAVRVPPRPEAPAFQASGGGTISPVIPCAVAAHFPAVRTAPLLAPTAEACPTPTLVQLRVLLLL